MSNAKHCEIELKLALAATDYQSCLLYLAQTGIELIPQTLNNAYYDNADHHLFQAKLALRIRSIAQKQYWQTLKSQGIEQSGLSQRGEWEWPLVEPQLNLKLLQQIAMQYPQLAILQNPSLLHRLSVQCQTNFIRYVGQYKNAANDLIEIAVDRGVIIAGQQSRDICEIELELKQGNIETIWQLAEQFSQHFILRPANAGKAQRAMALLGIPKQSQRTTHQATQPSFNQIIDLLDSAQDALVFQERQRYYQQAYMLLKNFTFTTSNLLDAQSEFMKALQQNQPMTLSEGAATIRLAHYFYLQTR